MLLNLCGKLIRKQNFDLRQRGAAFIKHWEKYYKLSQLYYKWGQVLQNGVSIIAK